MTRGEILSAWMEYCRLWQEYKEKEITIEKKSSGMFLARVNGVPQECGDRPEYYFHFKAIDELGAYQHVMKYLKENKT